MRLQWLNRLLLVGLALCPVWAFAQSDVYRCADEDGRNTFTDENGRRELLRTKAVKSCDRIAGAIATIPSVRPPTQTQRSISSSTEIKAAAASFPRVDLDTQRVRDGDRRRILEDELRVEEERLNRLRADYNNGQPLANSDEQRGSSRYIDRVQRIQEQIQRAENNVAALRRELALARG